MNTETLLREAGRALAQQSSGSRRWTKMQRRVLATLVLMQECTLEQAEAAFEQGLRDLSDQGYAVPWRALSGEIAYPLEVARGGFLRLRHLARPRLRLVHGGAT